MTRAGAAAELMATALLLAGCAHKRPAVRFIEAAEEAAPPASSRKLKLPPERGKDPPRAIAAASGLIEAPASARERLQPPRPAPRERPLEPAGAESLRPESSGLNTPGTGPAPDKSKARGDPEVRRPDELAPEPTDRPRRYASPASLRRVLNMPRVDDRSMAGVEPGTEGADADAFVAPADIPPLATAPLDDEVPDTVVSDPSELGSYRVQASSSSAFGEILFDKLYPFMADINLETDLRAIEAKPEGHWIRYAVVDLLGFEHPFTRPKRLFRPRAPMSR